MTVREVAGYLNVNEKTVRRARVSRKAAAEVDGPLARALPLRGSPDASRTDPWSRPPRHYQRDQPEPEQRQSRRLRDGRHVTIADIDLEIGRILRQILERGLHRELGFESFEDYVVERLDLSPRTARRLVRLARAPEAVATAFREGRITLLAAEAILRGAPLDETVTLRRLQEQVQPEVDFWAPPDVARLFLAMVTRMGCVSLPPGLQRPGT